MENYDDIIKSKKLLQYINEFWICFNEKDREDVLKILLRVLDRADANVNNIISNQK